MNTVRPKIRLFVPDGLSPNGVITLSGDQSHYAVRVMRQGTGDQAVLFNGRDGEWLGTIDEASKSACRITLVEQLREQVEEPDIWVVFAPIKKARLDFLIEKATELGVSRLVPVITERTEVSRVNTERLSATALEAAEQCERLSVPEVAEPRPLDRLIEDWPPDRALFLMDETGNGAPPTEVFPGTTGAAIIVGPEGGFSSEELDALRKLPFVTPVTLGARVLRTETAVVAALSNWQMLAGEGCVARRR